MFEWCDILSGIKPAGGQGTGSAYRPPKSNGQIVPKRFEVGRGGTRKTRGSQPERDNMAVFVTGDLHGGLDIQKLRDWEAGEKHVVLYDNIVALGAGSDSW